MRYMTIGLKKTVSLVVLPIDDFTERVITGSQLRMYTQEGNQVSIRKEDGYHVFCDLTGDTVRICAEGPLYQKQTVEFPVGDASTVYQMRMLPNTNYPLSSGTTCIRGCLRPGSRIRLFFSKQKKNYKLLYDYHPQKQECSLSLFLPEAVHLEGRTLYIRGQGEEGELFRVISQQDENCQLEEPLKKAYKKIGTTVCPVYETTADEDGNFYLPVRGLSEEDNPCTCIITEGDGQKEICRQLSLKAGKENRITEEIYGEVQK